MSRINWKQVQTHLGVTADGIPGPITYTAIYKYMGATTLAEPLGRATHARIGAIAANPRRLANWLGQMAHESGSFRRLVENLNYTKAENIRKTWPSRFATNNQAQPFVRNPEALANRVYGGRMGNVNAGDGWKFRGRGIIQLTGRSNYATYENRLKIPFTQRPELAADPIWAVTLAILYWNDRGLNEFADKDDRQTITRRINGGTKGFQDRVKRTNHALRLLG